MFIQANENVRCIQEKKLKGDNSNPLLIQKYTTQDD